MGNAESSPSHGPLHESDAFEIATHWRPQLHNWVTLTTHDEYARAPVAFVDAQQPIVRHFEWVTFGLPAFVGSPSEIARSAQAARASVVVWLALSSCAGFSGRENPRFWKRVFTVLWAGNQQPSITEDVRFFEHSDRPFPCVRIKPRLTEEKATLSAFFRAGAADRELRRVLQRLERHLAGREWWRRAVPVEIVEVELSVLSDYRPEEYLPKEQQESHGKPALRLVALRTSASDQSTAAFLTIARAFGENAAVHIATCFIEAHASSVVLLAQQALEVNQRIHIGTFRPRLTPQGEDPGFAALCSALPRSRMITAVELKGDNNAVQLDDVRVAWLGYALFHPDTAAKSALTALILGLPHVRTAVVDVLRHMATGNNLLLVMGATTTVSSAYHDAQLAARTRVHADDSAAFRVIHTFDDEQTVTLCVASLDVLADKAWVRVVVPGVGLGWIETKHIVSVVSRAPGRSPLRRLELSERKHHEGHLVAVAPQVLSLLGASLTHLKILATIPTQVLQAVLKECPKLQALRVSHGGECWSDSSARLSTPSWPRLRTLELLISGPFPALVGSQLDDLTCLRVIDQDPEKLSFAIDRESLLETLKRYPHLSHVYWSGKRCHPPPWWETSGYLQWWAPKPRATQRDCQSTSYGLLGENVRGVLDVAQVGLPLNERLAFLSVFGTAADGAKWLPRLTSDVVRLIFAFNSQSVPRQLLIKHNDDDPCE